MRVMSLCFLLCSILPATLVTGVLCEHVFYIDYTKIKNIPILVSFFSISLIISWWMLHFTVDEEQYVIYTLKKTLFRNHLNYKITFDGNWKEVVDYIKKTYPGYVCSFYVDRNDDVLKISFVKPKYASHFKLRWHGNII